MSNPPTHRERAEKAAAVINVLGTARDIARETFPRELMEAARKADRCGHLGEGLCSYCRDTLRDALDLYKEPDHE